MKWGGAGQRGRADHPQRHRLYAKRKKAQACMKQAQADIKKKTRGVLASGL